MISIFLALASSALLINAEEREFVAWMRQTNTLYTGDEYQFRLGIFISQQRLVREFNSNPSNSFKLKLNHLACLTPSEYRSLLGARPTSQFPQKGSKLVTYKVEEALDWREKGAVNEIKDQGQCGSCWAFSAITTQESIDQINNGKLLSLSESNLVDCVTPCGGCEGGWPQTALEYVADKQNGKFNLESDYPYEPVQIECRFIKSKGVSFTTGFESGAYCDEDDLKNRVATIGPASVCIDASHSSFQLYDSGIYSETHCQFFNLDHAVGCVGYGAEDGQDYWIIRNSWGKAWGEEGYMRMARNKDNMCGIAANAIYAKVK